MKTNVLPERKCFFMVTVHLQLLTAFTYRLKFTMLPMSFVGTVDFNLYEVKVNKCTQKKMWILILSCINIIRLEVSFIYLCFFQISKSLDTQKMYTNIVLSLPRKKKQQNKQTNTAFIIGPINSVRPMWMEEGSYKKVIGNFTVPKPLRFLVGGLICFLELMCVMMLYTLKASRYTSSI